MSGDELLRRAGDLHRSSGLVQAAQAYCDAADAMLQENQPDRAAALLADALTARKPKKLFSKTPKPALQTPQRHALAARFAMLVVGPQPLTERLGLLEELCAEFADDVAMRRLLADAFMNAGQISRAISEYQECLRKHADDPALLEAVGAAYTAIGRNDLGVERLRRAVEAYLEVKNIDGAIRNAQRLVALVPDSLDDALLLSSLLRGRERPQELVVALEHVAGLYHKREKFLQEVDVRREILALTPGREDIRSALAALYTRILEIDPDDQEAWSGLETTDAALAEQLRVLLMDGAPQMKPPSNVLFADSYDLPSKKPASAGGSDAFDGDTRQDQLDSAQPNGPAGAYARQKGYALLQDGDLVGASLCFERLLTHDADHSDLLTLAKCYAGLCRRDDALALGLRAAVRAAADDDLTAASAILDWLDSVAAPGDAASLLKERRDSSDDLYRELRNRLSMPSFDGGRTAAG